MAKAKRGRTKGRRFRVTGEAFDRYRKPLVVGKWCVIVNSRSRRIPTKDILTAHPTRYSVGHEFTILKEGEFTADVLRKLKKMGRLKELPSKKFRERK